MKKIEDYLPFYFGCKIEYGYDGRKEIGTLIGNVEPFGWQVSPQRVLAPNMNVRPELLKLILRPLSDMTEEEKIMLCALNMPNGWNMGHIIQTNDDDIAAMRIFDNKGDYKSLYIPRLRISPNNFIWLLSKHFDLFGLIESGLAIEKKSIKEEGQ